MLTHFKGREVFDFRVKTPVLEVIESLTLPTPNFSRSVSSLPLGKEQNAGE